MMYSTINQIMNRLSFLITVLITVYLTRVRGEDCGQEELARCAKPLQVLSTSELTINITRKDELDKLCPDLHAGLHCIRSYTRRCMTLDQRNNFNKLYMGTNQVIKDLCKEGDYQDEFLRHAPCLQVIKPEYEICAKRYQSTMQLINENKQQNSKNSTATTEEENYVKMVCCSFKEYLSCSEHTSRRICGEKTAQFTRGFLDKMSNTLITTYCENYFTGSAQCPGLASTASSHIFPIGFTTLYISMLVAYFWTI